MKVIAAYEQKTKPGENSAMECSVAKNERHGSSATWRLQDGQIFANHLFKGTRSAGHFLIRFAAPHEEQGREGTHACEHAKFVPPAYQRIQNGPESRAESDPRRNGSEHSAHRTSLNRIGIAVTDCRERDGDDSAASHTV